MVHTPRTPNSERKSAALVLKSPIAKLKKQETPGRTASASPSSARRKVSDNTPLRVVDKTPQRTAPPTPLEKTPQRTAPTPGGGDGKNYKEEEPLTVFLNVYDLVWNRNDTSENAKNAASGLENIGFGLYHSALEIWGKEISFGHSKRYKSGVFAVKPKRAQEYMPNTRYKTSIEMKSIKMSRYNMDKLLNRLAAKYTSDSYDVLNCNCNHFTEDLCMAICGVQIPDWINRPAKTGAAALKALNAPLKVLSALFGQSTDSSSSLDTQASLDRLTQITAVPDSADLVVPENRDSAQKQPGGSSAANSASNSASKNSAPGSGAGASNSGSAYKHKRSSAAGASNWLDSAGKENAAKNIEAADGRMEKRRRIDMTEESASTRLATSEGEW